VETITRTSGAGNSSWFHASETSAFSADRHHPSRMSLCMQIWPSRSHQTLPTDVS